MRLQIESIARVGVLFLILIVFIAVYMSIYTFILITIEVLDPSKAAQIEKFMLYAVILFETILVYVQAMCSCGILRGSQLMHRS